MGQITTYKPFSSQAIAQNESALSGAIDLRWRTEGGNFAIHYVFTGPGSLKIEYLLSSTPNGTFLTPSGAVVIVAAESAGSNIVSFAPEVAPYLKLKLTELNVGAITEIDLWLNFV